MLKKGVIHIIEHRNLLSICILLYLIMYNVELMHYLYKQQVLPLQPLQQPRHQTGPSPHPPLPLDL